MVAFTEFKQVTPKQKLNEDALPSNVMTAKEMGKTNPAGDRKYVIAMAQSIRAGKPFAVVPPGKSAAAKEANFGVVDTLSYNGKTMSSEEWESWANNPKTDPKEIIKTVISVDGENYTLNKIWKTEAATGGMSINKGDAAEAILGAAITAKFDSGGKDIKPVDVVNILKAVVSKGVVDGETNYQTAGIEDDDYSFKLTLNATSMKSLKLWIDEEDPLANAKDFQIVEAGVKIETIKDLQTQIKNAVEYANDNKRCVTAVEKAKADPAKNKVEIMSDGGDASQQSVTKVDLKITYDGQVTRLLSLKAGSVKQFGQGSGGGWKQVSDFFESVFNFRLPDTMKEKFGFKDPVSKKDTSYLNHNYNNGPFAKLYDEMAKQTMKYTQGDDTQKEYNLVKTIYDSINYHATRGEEGVTMVILSPKAKVAYQELAFDSRLLSALELYNLQVVNNPNKSGHYISVIGNLKTEEAIKTIGKDGALNIPSKNVLVQLSSRKSGGTIRNLVEMGPLLKDLADIEKLDKAEAEKKKQAQQDNTKPAATAQQEPKQINDPNAKVEENLMTPKPEFGPTFDIVDDLHIYMRNDPDAYRKSYYPMLCNMQKALENKEKISVKKMMMPTIKQCGADYNKKFGLASNIDEIMTMEQARELAKKIYDEEVPLMRKGAYK